MLVVKAQWKSFLMGWMPDSERNRVNTSGYWRNSELAYHGHTSRSYEGTVVLCGSYGRPRIGSSTLRAQEGDLSSFTHSVSENLEPIDDTSERPRSGWNGFWRVSDDQNDQLA